MALIYKITNKINNQSYIGKTIRPLSIRYKEHQKDCVKYLKNKKNTIPLYNAVNVYGWDNFTIEIIEENIPEEKINEKEQYYINYFDSYYNGYNATFGGDGGRTSSKLNDNTVKLIIKILSDENNLDSLGAIGKQFNVSVGVISTINQGKSWYNKELNYPLRKYNTTGLTINKKIYKKIIDDIQKTNLPLNKIAQKYNLSESQITAINNGYECYNGEHLYYSSIYHGPFPIRNTNKKIDICDNIQDILYDIIFTKDSMTKIGLKYNIQGNTLTYIANGKRRKELTKDYIVPLRNNIEENKKIYKKIYLIKEGD